ncbi:MAG: ABC transporter ATP-binding protein/permease [Acidimicrobiia bacterium]|nr:ABC transporter ATP-binding protein/permease [Acidimicrobiia bacterium]
MKVRSRHPIAIDPSDLRRAFTTFRPALRGQRARIVAAVALALTVTGLELVKPWPVTLVIDHLVGADDPSTVGLTPIVVFAAVAVAVPTLLGLANERLQLVVARVSRKATVRIRSDVFEHIHRLELREHQQHYSGDLLVRLMGDVNMIRDLLFPSWLNLLSRGSMLVGGAIVFALVDWRLFCVAMIPLPLLWVSLDRTSSAVKAAAGRQRRKEGAIAAHAAESIRQVGLIKAFAAESRTTEQFRNDARSAERATMAAARHAARMGRLTEVLTGAGVALVLVLGAMRTRAGLLTPGQLVLAISYTRMMYKPIRKLTGEGARVAKATASALRVLDLLEQPTEDPDDGVPVENLDGDIDFVDVGHVYHDGRAALDGLCLRIPDGSLVAVVGDNGTGKSTLLSLLLRLHRPTAGRIFIGGTPIDDYRLGAYRDHMSYVPQELALFGGTIRENIAFGRAGAGDDEIAAAVDAALLTPVLDRLPDGLDTLLDEDGASLSGGQARRVMLARAALRDSSVLLLDEPLTGLDPLARRTVGRAIANIARGRTTLVVHHGDLAELRPDYRVELTHSRPEPRTLRAVAP